MLSPGISPIITIARLVGGNEQQQSIPVILVTDFPFIEQVNSVVAERHVCIVSSCVIHCRIDCYDNQCGAGVEFEVIGYLVDVAFLIKTEHIYIIDNKDV